MTLQTAREEASLTIEDVAEKLHVSIDKVMLWEDSYKNITIWELSKVCKLYNVKFSDVLIFEAGKRWNGICGFASTQGGVRK